LNWCVLFSAKFLQEQLVSAISRIFSICLPLRMVPQQAAN
jgi:hypothetical protein